MIGKNRFLFVVIGIIVILFVTAVAMLVWFFLYGNQDPVQEPEFIEINAFEGLNQQESDRKVLELLSPNNEESGMVSDFEEDVLNLLQNNEQLGTATTWPIICDYTVIINSLVYLLLSR